MKKLLSALAVTAVLAAPFSAQASHIFVTNPSINGVTLETTAGFTNPTINATVGDDLDVLLGIFGDPGSWMINFSRTSGTIDLNNFGLNSSPANSANPNYYTFSQELLTAGTWTGFLTPISNESCPSYRYANGTLGGGGCGSPAEFIPFTLNVAARASAVPEPVSMALFGLGVVGLAATRRKAKSKAA